MVLNQESKSQRKKKMRHYRVSDMPVADEITWLAYRAELLGSAVCCLLELSHLIFPKMLRKTSALGEIS